MNVAEVLAGLAVSLASGLPDDVELEGDVTRVSGNLQTALHLSLLLVLNFSEGQK